MEANKQINGYLLEIQTADGRWMPYEFDCGIDPWEKVYAADGTELHDEWCKAFVEGAGRTFFAALPNVDVCPSLDWEDRLGVAFNAEDTPKNAFSDNWTWAGEVMEDSMKEDFKAWRVRRVSVDAALAPQVAAFYERHPETRPQFATDNAE